MIECREPGLSTTQVGCDESGHGQPVGEPRRDRDRENAPTPCLGSQRLTGEERRRDSEDDLGGDSSERWKRAGSQTHTEELARGESGNHQRRGRGPQCSCGEDEDQVYRGPNSMRHTSQCRISGESDRVRSGSPLGQTPRGIAGADDAGEPVARQQVDPHNRRQRQVPEWILDPDLTACDRSAAGPCPLEQPGTWLGGDRLLPDRLTTLGQLRLRHGPGRQHGRDAPGHPVPARLDLCDAHVGRWTYVRSGQNRCEYEDGRGERQEPSPVRREP